MTSPANGAITRIVPVNGLLVDADVWAVAHDYHRLHQQRHALLMHGVGIAAGLELVAHEPSNRTLIIYPGLAIDPIGSPILLPECERYTVQTEQPGPIYIILQFREVASGSRGPAGPGTPTHLREAYRIIEARTPPPEPHVELGRIWLTGGREPLVDAPDQFSPGPNQIDLRHRVEAGGLARAVVGIAHAWLDAMPAPVHPALPLRLVSALAELGGIRARFIGQMTPGEAVGAGALLYLANQGTITLAGADVEGMRAFLDAGGTILGDGCHTDAKDEFADTFNDLAHKLGRTLEPVTRGATLLRGPHLFGAPPPGSAPGDMAAADGMIYCGSDYGCALEGGQAKKPLDRAHLRAVQEMTANIAMAAYQRQRAFQFAADRRAP
jgi:hypothetical protein